MLKSKELDKLFHDIQKSEDEYEIEQATLADVVYRRVKKSIAPTFKAGKVTICIDYLVITERAYVLLQQRLKIIGGTVSRKEYAEYRLIFDFSELKKWREEQRMLDIDEFLKSKHGGQMCRICCIL
jgi:hypothetical protein